MSERLLEIIKLLSPLLGIVLGAITPQIITRLLPTDTITLNKWQAYGIAGVAGALVAMVVYWTYTGTINYWWGGAGFIGAACIFWAYRQYFAFPFKKFRVTCLKDDNNNVVAGKEDGKGLIANKGKGIYDKDKKGWICKYGWGVWGPYLHLTRGWYKATFRVKATGSEWDQEDYLFEIDVAASYRGGGTEDIRGDKKLAIQYITTRDVRRNNNYNNFPLVFCVYQDEDNIEFRVRPRSNSHTIVFGDVKLSRL